MQKVDLVSRQMGRVEPGTFRHPPLFTCLQIETMQIALIDIVVECIDMIPRIEDLSPIFRDCVGEIGEHTSELQSRGHLVCRLLLEKQEAKRRPAAATPASSP